MRLKNYTLHIQNFFLSGLAMETNGKRLSRRLFVKVCVIHFVLFMPSEIGSNRLDLLVLLRLANIFVHPSFSEGLPGALLEAMALGIACVATPVNAIPEAVKDHETGLLVPAGDSASLAAAISELYTDPLLRERLAIAGQGFVISHFDERLAAQITADYYHQCTNKTIY